MPRSADVAALIQAAGTRDFYVFKAIAEAMIARERTRDQEDAARTMELAVERYLSDSTTPSLRLPSEIGAFVWLEQPRLGLSELFLDPGLLLKIRWFVRERTQISKLREAGLPLRNRILLAGPPGNGKTSLAGALAKELDLPLIVLKSQTIVDSYIGRTARLLEMVFEFVRRNDCLFFMDELDSLGAKRQGGGGGQQEYNNILNSLLVNLDRLPDTTIVVGATNRLGALDPALTRRFNLDLHMGNPSATDIRKYILAYQAKNEMPFGIPLDHVVPRLEGKPWSKVAEYCQDRHRELILGSD
ncbi:ATP-dependent zinc metalloprotease FtsH [Peptococcaceae bacterium CEB3]|nr:ATP-dependent zinc metalloprotease FtsH [Peptococcaceae bacterium CEB3]